ncbi:thrombospondin type 3 repeat-containing protein [Tenacibaculum sp. 1B UA]|uniref:thrombospondin type 3 repeat-containing protein n=1 Tax=Tenacibaculum sp. 1B UA TaxID=2922252 RepID=UPI002A244418|nr:thrombospondin type 3 repeat-containing protein [Tenacibaculum sp. 1B UA]MDX8552541.1 thrombospondin type 3 repeat-containing protein [Tenacibaculum sp. 1B UA]
MVKYAGLTKTFTYIFPDGDNDGDGVLNSQDNCISISNSNQSDMDNDSIGDVCDSQDNRDSDGDGVQNWQDNCPNQAGPSSNNGCPVGNADLIINTSNSTTGVPGESTTTKSLSSTNITHYLYTNDELQIYLQIDNEGNTSSGNSKIGVYLSTENDINKAKEIKVYDLSNVNPGTSQTRSYSLSYWGLTSTYGISGQAYLHIKIDKNNDVDEGSDGEQNNTYSSRNLYFYNTQRKSAKLPTKLTIHDVNGNKINETTVNNKTEETDVIKSLPEGFYFIDKNGKKSKIYKKN